jgi:glycosyltransferase involved in cell wall biosynthesis
MKIVIDFQGYPAELSRNYGTSAYSLNLAEAIAIQRKKHDLRFALNDMHGHCIDTIKQQLNRVAVPGMFSYYRYPWPDRVVGLSEDHRRQVAAALIRQHFAQLRPDVLHLSNVMEGFWGQGGASRHLPALPGTICSATLCDLTPLIINDTYQAGDTEKSLYYQGLSTLKECDLLLAGSEASRKNAIAYLEIMPDKIVNISGAANSHFRPVKVTWEQANTFLHQYGINRDFLLYAGGMAPHNNLKRTISGYAKLPAEIRRHCQFVLAGPIQLQEKTALLDYVLCEGLADGDVVFTGFVPDDDLLLFYNLCTLFVFPSLYEGLGLPLLEAMACGAAVIGAGNSSIPEIIGRQDALFDAGNPEAIAQALYRGLADEGFREDLKSWGRNRSKLFRWKNSAQRAWEAFEEVYEKSRQRDVTVLASHSPRRKMAYFSSLDNPNGGIAAYSTELLPGLARYYEIDVFTDSQAVSDEYITGNFSVFTFKEFGAHSNDYDIVLYQIGNSPFHACMYEMLQRYPGVVVLHDFFIGRLLQYLDAAAPGTFLKEAEYSHGPGVRALHDDPESGKTALLEYPCNRRILDAATGVIFHSNDYPELVRQFYPHGIAAPVECIEASHKPDQIAVLYARAVERFTQQFMEQQQSTLVNQLGGILASCHMPEEDLRFIASCAIDNKPNFKPPRMLVDVSYLAHVDHHSGIQRVVKNIAEKLYNNRQNLFRPIPVRLYNNKLFPYVMDKPEGTVPPVTKQPAIRTEWNDILLMLDSSWSFYDQFSEVFTQVRRQRGSIYTVVYDLIPILYPHLTPSETSTIFPRWLHSAIQNSDGLLCISKAVADELIRYITEKEIPLDHTLKIGYFHLGADIKIVSSEVNVRPQVKEWFDNSSAHFLMVGWIDPRKGHDFALDAVEKLWAAEIDAKLIFAGKEGWNRREFISRVFSHPEYSKNLLWVNNPTDAEIVYCYRHAAALLVPSVAEGFGIPLIEAAHHGTPVICSDIPVFREVAGDFVTYCSLESPQNLTDILISWLKQPEHPRTAQMPRHTWGQSAQQLMNIILDENWYQILPPTSS